MKRRKDASPPRFAYGPLTSIVYLAFGLGWLSMLHWLVSDSSSSPNLANLYIDMRAAVLMFFSIPMFLYLAYAIVFLVLWCDLRIPSEKS
jgi:hypothetical protein